MRGLVVLPKHVAYEMLSCYLRSRIMHPGRWRLEHLAIRWSRELARPSARTVRTRRGFRLSVELNDWVGQHLFALGDYEIMTANLIEAILRPGDTFFDVGANIGFFSLLAARCVGAHGCVRAFEPLPDVRERLLRNIAMNGFTNVHVGEEALCNTTGTAHFHRGPKGNHGMSSLRCMAGSVQSIEVRTDRLDTIIEPEGRVRLAKIDVEGAEMEVLRGMRRCIEHQRPDIIVEVTDRYLSEFNSSAEEMLAELAAFGYNAFFVGDGSIIPITPDVLRKLPEQYNAYFTCAESLPAGIAAAQAS